MLFRNIGYTIVIPRFQSCVQPPEAGTPLKAIVFFVPSIPQSFAAVALMAAHFMVKNIYQENMFLACIV